MTPLRELAERMVEFFSEDALQWPLVGRQSSAGAAVRVSFRCFGSEVPDFGRELLSHLAAILATPYRNAKAGRVTALVYAPEVEDADVEVVLAEASAYDDRGIAYEMTFNGVGERYPGWFARPDEGFAFLALSKGGRHG
jgi:hypothetical protein